MNDSFRTDNEALFHRAGAFAGLSERAGRIVGDLTDRLSSYGECWGDDAPGQAFADCHVEPATAALQAIGTLPGGLLDVGGRLTATAARYDESELSGENAVRGAGSGLLG
jgi:hypothetical protein